MSLEIVALSEELFEPLRGVPDTVARERRFLAFTEAPPVEEANMFYRSIVANKPVMAVALSDGRVIGWCDALPVLTCASTTRTQRRCTSEPGSKQKV